MSDTKTRALDMLSTAALDHYTPHMICVPTDKWVEAFAVAGSLESTPPADAAMADVTEMIIRDACESDVASPDHPDSICINVDDLTQIVSRHVAALRARPQAVAEVPNDPPLSFTAYMEDNYPKGVRIQDPLWHAPKIWRAARRAMLAASTAGEGKV